MNEYRKQLKKIKADLKQKELIQKALISKKMDIAMVTAYIQGIVDVTEPSVEVELVTVDGTRVIIRKRKENNKPMNPLFSAEAYLE